jgi:murein DD-endopeptidase MepM/ murein hydrolase activator NlpD
MVYRVALIGAVAVWSGVVGVGGSRAQTTAKKRAASSAVKPAVKDCGDGVKLQLSGGSAIQGTLILAQVTGAHAPASLRGDWDGVDTPLWMEGKTNPSYHALLGVDLEKKPGAYEWKVSWQNAKGDAVTCSVPITVRAGKFPTERLTVEKQFVQPDPEQEKRAAEDQKKMKAIYDTVTPEKLWDGKFRIPLDGVTTGGNFGRRRVLNGESRSPHGGVDLPAQTGTPVFAAQAGKVVLAEPLYYSGNTVVIDHGYGIYTMYAHLSEIDVKPGQAVKLSDGIGKVGATGRVTGPHLHWGLTIDHARVNALNIAKREP